MTTQEQIAELIRELPLNKWENFGDVAFDIYGGVAVLRDDTSGKSVQIVEVTPMREMMVTNALINWMEDEFGMEREDAENFVDSDEPGPYVVLDEYLDVSDIEEELLKERSVVSFAGAESGDLRAKVFAIILSYIPYYGADSETFRTLKELQYKWQFDFLKQSSNGANTLTPDQKAEAVKIVMQTWDLGGSWVEALKQFEHDYNVKISNQEKNEINREADKQWKNGV